MSFGLEVINDLNRKVIDENNSLYSITPASVTKGYDTWSEGGALAQYGRNTVTIRYDRPYKSQSPPMVFMRGGNQHPSIPRPHDWTYIHGPIWYHEIHIQHFGSIGNWTGVFIAQVQNLLYTNRQPFDYRPNFIVAGTGAVPQTGGGYGLQISKSNGVSVFNSNENFIEVVQYSNSWRYLGRYTAGSFGVGGYTEQWINDGIQVPTSNDEWITVPLFSKIRRYNGENAVIWPSDLTKGYNPRVSIESGRSHSPFSLPLYRIKMRKPTGYRFV